MEKAPSILAKILLEVYRNEIKNSGAHKKKNL
jgi:hypothetical protein